MDPTEMDDMEEVEEEETGEDENSKGKFDSKNAKWCNSEWFMSQNK